MSVQIDTEATALTGEQRLYAAMQEFVDPAEYRGDYCERCLIGQVAAALGFDPGGKDAVEEVADHFDVFISMTYAIFGRAARQPYIKDFDAAMQMAAAELGLAPTGKEERCRE